MSARKTRLYSRVQLAARLMQKAADRHVGSDSGLTTAQAGVLSVLETGEGETQKEIAQRLGVGESAMTPMLGRLIRLGYVRKTVSPVDARARTLSISASGRRALGEVRGPFARVNETIESVLTDLEIDALASALNRLIDAFESEAP